MHLLESSQEGLEGDCGRDRLQWCRLLSSFQEGPYGAESRKRPHTFCYNFKML